MNTVLVLEDDPANMQVISAVLWSEGYRVLEATNGREAIEAGNGHASIDLLLADITVPEGSGTEVARELLQSHPTLPILFMSGNPIYAWDRRDLQNLSDLPTDGVAFLEKPFGATALLEKIGGLLERVFDRLGARH